MFVWTPIVSWRALSAPAGTCFSAQSDSIIRGLTVHFRVYDLPEYVLWNVGAYSWFLNTLTKVLKREMRAFAMQHCRQME